MTMQFLRILLELVEPFWKANSHIFITDRTPVFPTFQPCFEQSDSPGTDSIRLYYIGFIGDTRSSRKEGNQKLEIPAANAPDARIDGVRDKNAAGQQTTAR